MILTARLLTLLAVISFLSGCRHSAPSPAASGSKNPAGVLAEGSLLPSARLIVGRVIAVDATQGFAFVDLATDAPAAALTNGTDLIVRALDLRETARVRVSRHVRGRTLGTKIVGGQPSPGDEVVWLAP
jgi:hypothetical protein